MAKDKERRKAPRRTAVKRGLSDMNTGDRKPRPEELVEIFKPTATFQEVRLVGDVWPYSLHWIRIQKQDGGVVNVPKPVPNYDPKTDIVDETIKDPYLKIPNYDSTSKHYFVNVIVRDLQENMPRKQPAATKKEQRTGHKEKDSKTWTPVRVMRLPTSVVRELQGIKVMNVHDGQQRELADPEYGRDVFIKYDKEIKGPQKYSVQRSEHRPLTDEEQEYLLWDISNLIIPETPEEAKREAKTLAEKAVGRSKVKMDENEDDDDDGGDILEDDLPWSYKDEKKDKKKDGKKNKKAKDKKANEEKGKKEKPKGGKMSALDKVRRRRGKK